MYTQVTKQGYEIISKIKEENGRLHVIAKRKADYIVCLGYNEQTGTWDQGRYDFKTLTDATKALFEEKFSDDKIIIRVVECTDSDEVYGALAIPRTISVLDVQQTIYDIKAKFQDEESELYNEEWQIEDVMEQLSKIYPDVEWLDNYVTWDYIEI